MKINAKFDLGQKIHAIIESKKETKEICELCEGDGHLKILNFELFECPKCFCKGYTMSENYKARYIPNDSYYNFKVEKIVIEIYEDKSEKTVNYYYMDKSSGNIFNEKNCFASIEEAQKECNIRNEKKEFEMKEERSIKELLEYILSVLPEMLGRYSTVEGEKWHKKNSGICDVVGNIYSKGIFNDFEEDKIYKFLYTNLPISRSNYCWPKNELKPRQQWLKEQIAKLEKESQ